MANSKRYGMVIDTKHCVGCQTCTVSCKISNEVPGTAQWNHLESLDGEVLYQSTGTFPKSRLAFRPMLCNHCENPACVANCPSGAMRQDPETGIVSVKRGGLYRLRLLRLGVPLRRAVYGRRESCNEQMHVLR